MAGTSGGRARRARRALVTVAAIRPGTQPDCTPRAPSHDFKSRFASNAEGLATSDNQPEYLGSVTQAVQLSSCMRTLRAPDI